MGLFISSTGVATSHGVYAIQRTPPPVIQATGTSNCVIVGQFPWGPSQTLYKPSDVNDRIQTIAPFGMSHLGSGYLSTIAKGFPALWILRICNAADVAATVALQTAGAVTVATFTAKYPGTAGNSITATVAAGSDGNANHVDITFTVTGATGTTTDVIRNFNGSAVGTLSVIDFTKLRLVGSVAFGTPGIIAIATTSFSSGTSGAIVASDYVGTQGAADKGMAKLEGDSGVNHVFTDDPGNSIRIAVNTGLFNHGEYTSSRMVYINGPTGQSLAAVATDVASYRSQWARYVDPWVYILDDTTGAKALVPPSSFAASCAAQLPPSVSIAWKSPEVTQALLRGIVDVETQRGGNNYQNTLAGVCTLQPEPTGGYSFEADVTTLFPSDPTKKTGMRSQVAIYIAKSGTQSIRSSVDSPNLPYNQQPIVDALDDFLSQMKRNASIDPNHLVSIRDYSIDNVASFNSLTDQQNGLFTVPFTVQTAAPMEKILLSMNIGDQVSITLRQ